MIPNPERDPGLLVFGQECRQSIEVLAPPDLSRLTMQMSHRMVRTAIVILVYLFVLLLFDDISRLWLGNRL